MTWTIATQFQSSNSPGLLCLLSKFSLYTRWIEVVLYLDYMNAMNLQKLSKAACKPKVFNPLAMIQACKI